MVTNTSMDYALLGLIFLAKNGDKNVKIGDIAKAEYIPVTFLQKIFQKLAKAGIVEAQFGPKGGYRLAKPASNITLKEIFLVIHSHEAQCERAIKRLQKHPGSDYIIRFIQTLHADFLNYLNEKTLSDLLKK